MPKKKRSKLMIARENADLAVTKTNVLIDAVGYSANELYNELTKLQKVFDTIRNAPEEEMRVNSDLKKTALDWKQQADDIEKRFTNSKIGAVGEGAAGVGAGVAVAAMGPTAAMGVATTFGVASTGTAISTLSGAAATNAALAWLGGGALAAGGGGMAAGQALLALAGPIGWSIAGFALLSSGIFMFITKRSQRKLENIFTLISARDVKKNDIASLELKERIVKIGKDSGRIESACNMLKGFGTNYNRMTEQQQYELGSWVNLMKASTQLLVDPIYGLQPNYCSCDYDRYVTTSGKKAVRKQDDSEKELVISLANLLYNVELNNKDKTLLFKHLKRNKQFLKSMKMKKRAFNYSIMEQVFDALSEKYRYEKEHS